MKKIIVATLISFLGYSQLASLVLANNLDAITLGNTFLQSNQDETGKITGYGGESQWAAIAFASSNADVTSIKNPSASLKDFLLSDKPADNAAATEWERRILAIVAIGENPSNFGGTNYIETLQALSKDNQIGDPSLLNDDIFGLLALIASGDLANQKIKEDALTFIINHQATDGGFSWSADSSCGWCGSDGNDTASALQALQAAKNNGMTHPNLDTTIEKGKGYLLSTQKSDGGFAYDTFSEADGSSTAWALMALNALDLSSSPEAEKAVSWLKANQGTDGGFQWMSGYGGDTYTTSHAVVALNGKSWIIKIYTPAASPSPTATPNVSPLPTATPLPTPITSVSVSPTPSPSPSPSPNVQLSTLVTIPTPSPQSTTVASLKTQLSTATRFVEPKVLGTTIEEEQLGKESTSTSPSPSAMPIIFGAKNNTDEKSQPPKYLTFSLFIFGSILVLIITLKIWEKRKGK